MKKTFFTLSYLFFCLLLSACQTLSFEKKDSRDIYSAFAFPMATAVQVSYQDEVTLLRINQLLTEKKTFSNAKRAVLFYERGLLYDKMGLSAHSRYDFTQAINSDPTFAPAYNSLGLYLLLAQSYDEAFEAFDSALELSNQTLSYSYLHRAIALYEVHRYHLASQDIETFYKLDKTDPYRILWRYIINSALDKEKALQALKSASLEHSDDRYIWNILDVIAQRKTEEELLVNVFQGVKSNNELAERLCEIYFYLAHWYKSNAQIDKAIYYFKLSTATNIHEFIEYKYALIELSAIQTQVKILRQQK
ncbi:lipoprotein NlpI [Psychromonas sp. CD1]|uniref:lipoprotein NlpI n=1 Tax=Psychromonas sp. CD1 TaxID=1979839 RepID=UPI000B9A8C4E|nr:lipoprotein NlpI [Psychromonas sp. CD1]